MSVSTTGIKPESKANKESGKPVSDVSIRSSASEPPSPNSKEANVVSRTYLRDAAEHLLTWMHRMQSQDISPANVNAVCNLAQQVSNIVKVNIDIKKSGL